MLIKPENMDPSSESSPPITNKNVVTGPGVTKITYRKKAYIHFMWTPSPRA